MVNALARVIVPILMITRYQTSNLLQIFPSESKGIIIENISTKSSYHFDDVIVLSLLEYAMDPMAPNDLIDFVLKYDNGLDRKECQEYVLSLIKFGILVEENQQKSNSDEWSRFNWHSPWMYYHAIRDYAFLDYSDPNAMELDKQRMSEYMAVAPKPPLYKDMGEITIAFEKDFHAFDDYSFVEIFLGARSVEKKTEIKDIGDIFYFSFGETGKLNIPVQGELLLKVNPSGGARHPAEAYLVLFENDIASIYHYSVRHNGLEKVVSIPKSEFYSIFYEIETGVSFVPKGVVILSLMVERSMWRYRDPRAYRVIMNDMGHIIETFRLLSRAKGLETYVGHGFDDSRAEKIIGLDSAKEPIFRFIAFG